jgi:hypothetical protein
VIAVHVCIHLTNYLTQLSLLVAAGALEKQKFVYVLNRDSAANLTISSPLEAHKSHNICFALTALDCGFDNPTFAAIELDYSDADQVRKYWQLFAAQTASMDWNIS